MSELDLPPVRGQLMRGETLAPFTWFRVGGLADALFLPADEADLAQFLAALSYDVSLLPIGVGSNLIVRDGGVPGVVIRLAGRQWAQVETLDGARIKAGAGALDAMVARAAAKAGVAGLEFYAGIPGTIGGALTMNAGCYGAETKDVLIEASAINRQGKRITLTNAGFGFTYRHNALPEGLVFIDATFQGRPDDPVAVSARMAEITARREATQPIREKTGGSTFKNPFDAKGEKLSAWKLVDEAGMRGARRGGAQVSEKHANFLINTGEATAADIEALGEDVRAAVKAKHGIQMEWEIKRVGAHAAMILFQWTLVLLGIAVLLAGFSRRIGVPYPSLLALAGSAIAFLPIGPEIRIDPELALALFVAPVLVDAAFDTSPRDLKRNAMPLISLVFGMVALTVAAVAFVGWRWGGLPIAAAIALGAIVAPPDAVAASAVLGSLKLPRRITQILQGESLFNDAPALLIYRFAVAAAVGGFTWASAGPAIALAAVGSVVVGFALAYAYIFATRRITDAASYTVLTFVGTFGVWILAEHLHLSAIITMVVYAMTLAGLAPQRTSARLRVSSYSVWETAVFVLNVLAFVIMGLQVRPILERLEGPELQQALWFSAAVLATVILVRIVYVLGYNTAVRAKNTWFGVSVAEGVSPPTFRGGVVVAWCGMRGLVTLATAFALPANFPGRDLIVLAAFVVVIGTLVVQGMTLKPLLRLLAFSADDAVEQEVSRGRVAIMHTALDLLAADYSEEAAVARKAYLAALTIAESDTPQGATDYEKLRLKIIPKQRATLAAMRERGDIGDEAFHRLEEELDWAELNAAPAGHFQPLTTD